MAAIVKTEKKLKKSKVISPSTSVVKMCPVESAIQALLNTSTRVVRERKLVIPAESLRTGYDGPIEFPEYKFDSTVLGTLKGLLGPKTYKFKVSRGSTLSSGTGTFTIATDTDLTKFQEGAALIALFEESRLLSGKLVMAAGGFSGMNSFAWQLGYYPALASGSITPTVNILVRLRYQITGGSVYSGGVHELSYRTEGRMWGATSTEGARTPPISPAVGFDGCMMWVATGSGTPSNSNPYYSYVHTAIGEFRSRT